MGHFFLVSFGPFSPNYVSPSFLGDYLESYFCPSQAIPMRYFQNYDSFIALKISTFSTDN